MMIYWPNIYKYDDCDSVMMTIDVERLRCFIQTLIAYKRIITYVMMNNKGELKHIFLGVEV